MKTKIANALRTKFSNLGLGEKAFNGVAEFLVNTKTVEKEEDIENAIAGENVGALLRAFQGESDSLRQQKATLQKEYEEYKAQHPSTVTKPEPPKPGEDLLNRLKALEDAQKARDTKAATDALLKEAARLMEQKNCKGDKLISLALKDIAIEDGDTADKIAERAIPVYNTWRKDLYGDSPIPGVAAPAAEGYKKGDYSDFAQKLKESGQLPADK